MKQVKRAACEPSSWAGIAATLQALASVLPQYAPVIHIATVVAGAVAVGLREKGAK